MSNITIPSTCPSKMDIEIATNVLVNGINNGSVDALEAMATAKAITKVAETISKVAQTKATEQYLNRGNHLNNVKVATRETGVQFDYTYCNAWLKISAEEAQLVAKRKAIEEALRRASAQTPFLDTESGEMITVPAPKTSTSSLVFTFK